MLASMASFTLPNPALVRTVRLRRPAAQLSRWASLDANQERRIYEVDHQVRWREVFLLVSCVVRSISIEGGGRK